MGLASLDLMLFNWAFLDKKDGRQVWSGSSQMSQACRRDTAVQVYVRAVTFPNHLELYGENVTRGSGLKIN